MHSPATMAVPADTGAAIREAKAQLRARIGDARAVIAEVEESIRAEVASVVAAREARPVWPVVEFSDIAAGTVPGEAVEAIRARGCVVVRGDVPARPGRGLGCRAGQVHSGEPVRRDVPGHR